MNVVYVVERKNWNEQSLCAMEIHPPNRKMQWKRRESESKQNGMKTNQNLFNPKYFCIRFTLFYFLSRFLGKFAFSFDAIWTVQFSVSAKRNLYANVVSLSFDVAGKNSKKRLERYDKTRQMLPMYMFQTLSNYKWTNFVTKLWFTSIRMSAYSACQSANKFESLMRCVYLWEQSILL